MPCKKILRRETQIEKGGLAPSNADVRYLWRQGNRHTQRNRHGKPPPPPSATSGARAKIGGGGGGGGDGSGGGDDSASTGGGGGDGRERADSGASCASAGAGDASNPSSAELVGAEQRGAAIDWEAVERETTDEGAVARGEKGGYEVGIWSTNGGGPARDGGVPGVVQLKEGGDGSFEIAGLREARARFAAMTPEERVVSDSFGPIFERGPPEPFGNVRVRQKQKYARFDRVRVRRPSTDRGLAAAAADAAAAAAGAAVATAEAAFRNRCNGPLQLFLKCVYAPRKYVPR